jgi:nickel-dependent lactate racemase
MHIELPYGKGVLPVHLDVDADIISGRECPPLDMAEDKILDALRSPIGCRPLRDLVSPQSSVVIVHTDITRPTPNHIILPVILKELIGAGATRENISLLNATGSHRGQSMDELAAMLGEDTVRDYRIIQHDAFNPGELVFTGRTASGNDIYLNREYVGADLRIVTGFIEPHFFAGFSGGPKALLPGIAGIGSIMANHCAVNIGNPDAVWGKTIGNPVWGEIARAATFAPPHFCLNVSLDIDKRITGIFAVSSLPRTKRAAPS